MMLSMFTGLTPITAGGDFHPAPKQIAVYSKIVGEMPIYRHFLKHSNISGNRLF